MLLARFCGKRHCIGVRSTAVWYAALYYGKKYWPGRQSSESEQRGGQPIVFWWSWRVEGSCLRLSQYWYRYCICMTLGKCVRHGALLRCPLVSKLLFAHTPSCSTTQQIVCGEVDMPHGIPEDCRNSGEVFGHAQHCREDQLFLYTHDMVTLSDTFPDTGQPHTSYHVLDKELMGPLMQRLPFGPGFLYKPDIS